MNGTTPEMLYVSRMVGVNGSPEAQWLAHIGGFSVTDARTYNQSKFLLERKFDGIIINPNMIDFIGKHAELSDVVRRQVHHYEVGYRLLNGVIRRESNININTPVAVWLTIPDAQYKQLFSEIKGVRVFETVFPRHAAELMVEYFNKILNPEQTK
jgi:hypothetical protein